MKKPRAPREFLFVILRGSIAATGSPSAGNQPFHQWRHLRTALLFAVGLAVAMQFVEYWGLFAGTEGRVLDFFLRVRPPEAQTVSVILIEIDDEAYGKCFSGISPLDPKRLEQVVESLVTLDPAPRVLGVDIITDSKVQENKAAYKNLRELGKTRVVWAAGADVSITRRSSFWSWFKGTEDELLVQPTGVLGIESMNLALATSEHDSDPFEWGLPVFPPDEDLRLRRFPREISMIFANGFRPLKQYSWARKIAAKLPPSKIKEDVSEVLLSYSIPPIHYPLLSLYDCNPQDGTIKPKESEEFKKLNPVLLLGGTFTSSGDFHDTSEGRTSGLEINARAVQAELAGNGIYEFARWKILGSDTIIGLLIGLLFGHEQSIRRLTWGNWLVVALGLTLICLDLKGVWIFAGCVVLVAIGWEIQRLAGRGQRIRAVIWAGLAVVLVVVLLSYFALSRHYVWLSCVGVALGVNLHVIYEAYMSDVRASKAEQ